jgi:hypothetical protein
MKFIGLMFFVLATSGAASAAPASSVVKLSCPENAKFQLQLAGVASDGLTPRGGRWEKFGLLTFNRLYVTSHDSRRIQCGYNNIPELSHPTPDANLIFYTMDIPDGVTCPADQQSSRVNEIVCTKN